MTVKELITKLLEFDLDEFICIDASRIDDDSDLECLDIAEIYIDEMNYVCIYTDR